jgi:bis(5'-nucleosyl)-tetraphosphatase (symmetrical)
MANYAIGDVQGCFSALTCLLQKIHFDAHKDTLWFAGDLVNRGPDSLKTIEFIKSLGSAAHVVLGNHDLHMIAVALNCAPRKKKDTFSDLLDSENANELIDWLRQQALVLKIDLPECSYIMCHAGIPPQWTADEALQHSKEVETVLQSKQAEDFLRVMYGNQPDCWHESLQGFDRLRIITNYCTRMRFCDKDGRLELDTKESASDAPPGFLPWFHIKNRKAEKQHIVVGHWAALQGETGIHTVHALDTGCVWGYKLSAMRLEDQQRFSCDCSHG